MVDKTGREAVKLLRSASKFKGDYKAWNKFRQKHKEPIDLSGADLSGLNLRGCNLCGLNLSGANMEGAQLEGANLSGTNLQGANLQNAQLSHFLVGDLNESLFKEAANLSDADLRGANLAGARLQGANLNKANLQGANLQAAAFGAIFIGGQKRYEAANLSGANLSSANLTGAVLQEANLTNAKLVDSKLNNANLQGADLSGARVDNCQLINADLRDANVTGVYGEASEPHWNNPLNSRVGHRIEFLLPMSIGRQTAGDIAEEMLVYVDHSIARSSGKGAQLERYRLDLVNEDDNYHLCFKFGTAKRMEEFLAGKKVNDLEITAASTQEVKHFQAEATSLINQLLEKAGRPERMDEKCLVGYTIRGGGESIDIKEKAETFEKALEQADLGSAASLITYSTSSTSLTLPPPPKDNLIQGR